MSLTHSTRAAVETSTRAVGKGLGLGDDRNVWLSHAEVLLNTHNPQQALEVLESNLPIAWQEGSVHLQRVREAQIYARALHGVGRTHEALLWVERAQQLVEAHNLWQVRHRVDATRGADTIIATGVAIFRKITPQRLPRAMIVQSIAGGDHA
jgi:hypothetical protein